MDKKERKNKIELSVKSYKLLNTITEENPFLKKSLENSKTDNEFISDVKNEAYNKISQNKIALGYYKGDLKGREYFNQLNWDEIAAIRILDYIDHSGEEYTDSNLRGSKVKNQAFNLLWMAYKHGSGGTSEAFFEDMTELFRQFSGKSERTTTNKTQVENWMNRWYSGLDEEVIKERNKNRDRIINIFIDKIDKEEINDRKYSFDKNISREEKYELMLKWWDESLFHLRFAIRSPDLLNEMLDYSLSDSTLNLLDRAKKAGIPTFVNPYYLSLLNVKAPMEFAGSDLAIRHYILYSEQLVNEFGHIVAWEKEDEVEPGKPNAAGWILPSYHSVHRRYPEVSILIPETVGRACGGLCSSCQRMYDFQNGNLNFNLDKLRPDEKWSDRLERYMKYWEDDTQLRDILITGGDALMSSDKSIKNLLDSVYDMAVRKKEANKNRADGEKYAEMLRVRLGTRLPVYLPQRITEKLAEILKDFKSKAKEAGIKQFIIQTHFESPMEITPEAKEGIKKLISSGWTITNQLVFTAAASRRGHTAKLRKALNDIGVLTYYTFTVKGYMENAYNFATNARAVQEQIEEKFIGTIPEKDYGIIKDFPLEAEKMTRNISELRRKNDIPFLATDRNVLNMPGVGKSLTYRTIGITRDGRRILEFDHDATRKHSPIIHKMGKVIIIESKSIKEYLDQLEDMGENTNDYKDVYGYTIGETEKRMPIYNYPDYDFEITEEMTNLDTSEA